MGIYFCNMIGGIGLGLATETVIIPALIIVAFALYYPKVIRDEEMDLMKRFGMDYQKYRDVIPRFFPRFYHYQAPEQYTVNTKVFSRELFRSFWLIFGLGFLELIEALQESGMISTLTKIW